MAVATVAHHRLRIAGQDVDTDRVFELIDPQDERVVATVARGGIADADAAVEAARAAFESGVWSRQDPRERSLVLQRIAKRMGDELEELVELEIECNGATVRQATGFHVGYALTHMAYFADLAGSYPFESHAETARYPTLAQSFVQREPIGVVAAIVPWNFPLLLALWKVGPALAAGNSVVVKPDEKTPLTILRFAQIAEECGLPAGVLNVVTGSGSEVGAHLAGHPSVDKVAFTGSTAVGREIMRLAAPTVKRVTLELGGKSPVVVLDDADLEVAVDAALFACFLYSGQVCEAGSRLLLPDALHDEFVARMVARVATLELGDTRDWETDVGPVVSRDQRDRILDFVASGVSEGARVACGGEAPRGARFDHGFWVEPTIFTEVRNDMRIAREEIFGPVLSVIRYEDEAAAIAIANDTIYGLASGVWSSDPERALAVAREIRAGTVWINDHHMINCGVPFGGYKQSGVGRELGPRALDEYTEVKNVHLDLSGRLDRKAYDVLLSTPPAGA